MSDADQIDYQAVRRYFAATEVGEAASASYMAHAQDLPEDATRYRFRGEQATIREWLDPVRPDARVLDLGCGSGAWTELFADRFGSVTAVEQSPQMMAAARATIGDRSNVEFSTQDVREELPAGPFDLIFFGGLCLYLNDVDTVGLVRVAAERLNPGGRMILRESTVLDEYDHSEGDYEAIYRNVDVYRTLLQEAGLSHIQVRRNYAYTYMEMAVELVELRRRYLRILPRTSPVLGAMTWWALRAIAPISFWIFPRATAQLRVAWPKLQNHFFFFENAHEDATMPTKGSS